MVFVQGGEVYVLGERCCDRSRQRLDRRAFPSGVGQINDISWVDETGRYPDHSATIRLRERSRLLSLREMRSRPAMIRKNWGDSESRNHPNRLLWVRDGRGGTIQFRQRDAECLIVGVRAISQIAQRYRFAQPD